MDADVETRCRHVGMSSGLAHDSLLAPKPPTTPNPLKPLYSGGDDTDGGANCGPGVWWWWRWASEGPARTSEGAGESSERGAEKVKTDRIPICGDTCPTETQPPKILDRTPDTLWNDAMGVVA